jgi:REP element-mobilizing transposase RayT
MPRPLRAPSPTGLFHVTSRAVAPLRLFADPVDCDAFRHGLSLVAGAGVRVFAFCLMGTHFHLLVRAEPEELAAAMRRLKGWYAHTFNKRRGRVGPVFDERYDARPIVSERHGVAAAVYIDLNPVRAGLRSHPAQWTQSSYRCNAGLEPRPVWLAPLSELGLLGDTEERVAAAYRELVDATLAGTVAAS